MHRHAANHNPHVVLFNQTRFRNTTTTYLVRIYSYTFNNTCLVLRSTKISALTQPLFATTCPRPVDYNRHTTSWRPPQPPTLPCVSLARRRSCFLAVLAPLRELDPTTSRPRPKGSSQQSRHAFCGEEAGCLFFRRRSITFSSRFTRSRQQQEQQQQQQ